MDIESSSLPSSSLLSLGNYVSYPFPPLYERTYPYPHIRNMALTYSFLREIIVSPLMSSMNGDSSLPTSRRCSSLPCPLESLIGNVLTQDFKHIKIQTLLVIDLVLILSLLGLGCLGPIILKVFILLPLSSLGKGSSHTYPPCRIFPLIMFPFRVQILSSILS